MTDYSFKDEATAKGRRRKPRAKGPGSYSCPLCGRYMHGTSSRWVCYYATAPEHGDLGIISSLDLDGKIFPPEVVTLAERWDHIRTAKHADKKGGDRMKAITAEDIKRTRMSGGGSVISPVVDAFLKTGLDAAVLDQSDLGMTRATEDKPSAPRTASTAAAQLTAYLAANPDIPVVSQTRKNADGETEIVLSRTDTEEGAKVSAKKIKRTRKAEANGDSAEATIEDTEDQDALDLANAGA